VLAALRGRDRTGHGAQVDVAMFDAALSLLEGAALHYLALGSEPPRLGNMHHSISPFGTFACADAPIVVCAAHDGLFGVLCTVLGRPQLVTDPRFADNGARSVHRDALSAELEAALGGAPATEWLERLTAAGVPCSAVGGVGAALDSAQAAARRMVVSAGGLPMPGNPMKIAPYPDPERRPGPPELDEHGAAVRLELGLPPV
jgi:CoA:oxalate CoA-transferase